MLDSSTSGIRGHGHNIYYFPSYTGRQFDAPKPTHTSHYPRVIAKRKFFGRRNSPHGTRYDVRATYSPSHVLRSTSLVEPISISPTLRNQFLRASVQSTDRGRVELEEEKEEKKNDAKPERVVLSGAWILKSYLFVLRMLVGITGIWIGDRLNSSELVLFRMASDKRNWIMTVLSVAVINWAVLEVEKGMWRTGVVEIRWSGIRLGGSIS